LEYAARNAKIILAARRTELLEQVKKECLALEKTKVVEIIKCDITVEEDLIAVVEKVKKEFGVLNTVIVNAGMIFFFFFFFFFFIFLFLFIFLFFFFFFK